MSSRRTTWSDGGSGPTGGNQVKDMVARNLCAALVLVSVSLTSCASADAAEKKGGAPTAVKVPGWMDELEASFPSSKYLAAVGSGATRRDADSDAAGALARQFSVHVQVDSEAQQRYADIVKGDSTYSESERSISQTVGTQAKEQFVNLRFSDPYTDTMGTVHTVAYIERAPTATIYRTLIGKDLDKAARLRGRASAAEGALQRFALYDASYQVGLNARRLISQLRIIHNPSSVLLESDVDQAVTVSRERDVEANKLAYRLEIEGDEDGKIAGIVRNALASQSLSSRADGELAVRGTWSLEPVQVNPKYKSVRWTVNLSLLDEKGTAVATVFKEARENGVGEAEARAFAYREAEKRLGADLTKSLQDYLTRVATKD